MVTMSRVDSKIMSRCSPPHPDGWDVKPEVLAFVDLVMAESHITA